MRAQTRRGQRANAQVLEVDFTAPAGGTVVPAGKYDVVAASSPGTATAQHKAFDSSCNDNKVDATGGTVMLSAQIGGQSTVVSFSYTIQFEDGTAQAGVYSGAAAFCDTSTVATGFTCAQ